MKTAMKRLLSFVLVAMMLVSVLPFAASAAAKTVYITVYTEGVEGGTSLGGHEVPEEFDDDDIVKIVEDAGYKGTFSVRKDDDGENIYVDFVPAPATKTVYITVYTKNVEGGNSLGAHEVPVEFADADIEKIVKDAGYKGTFSVRRDEDGENVYVDFVPAEEPKPEPETPEITYQVQIGGVAKYTSAAVEATKVEKTAVEAAIAEAMKTVEAGSVYYDDDVNIKPAIGTTVTEDTTVVIKIDKVYQEYTVEFYDDIDATEPIKTLTTKKHVLDKSKVPGDPEKDDYRFLRWDTAKKGFELDFVNLANPLTDDYKFYARFEKTDGDKADKFSDIEIIAKRYANGREKEETILYTIEDVKDGANIYDVLRSYQKTINDEINDLGWNGEWIDNTFYMNSKGSEELDKDEELDGDCTVYVMVGEGDTIKVQLYVHTSYKEQPEYIINMFGYEADDILYKADINEALENKWSDREYSWKGMYSDKDWTDILGDKENVTAKSSYYLSKYIDDDADQTVNVHIYAKRVYSSSSDNPKTGDSVLMAVTVMGLSATALAAAYFFMKKRAA